MKVDIDNDPTARFDVSPNVDVFGEWRIYLIDCNDQSRILYKHSDDSAGSGFILRQGEFDACVGLAWKELNRLLNNVADDPN